MKEVEKMAAAQKDSRKISDFIDWLADNGYAICTLQKTGFDGGDFEEVWMHKRKSHEEMLADYFEIDLDKVEEERREILESLQNG